MKYCKCSIYAFISNMTILTFSKAMDWDLLEEGMGEGGGGRGGLWIELRWGVSRSGGKSQEVRGSKV